LGTRALAEPEDGTPSFLEATGDELMTQQTPAEQVPAGLGEVQERSVEIPVTGDAAVGGEILAAEPRPVTAPRTGAAGGEAEDPGGELVVAQAQLGGGGGCDATGGCPGAPAIPVDPAAAGQVGGSGGPPGEGQPGGPGQPPSRPEDAQPADPFATMGLDTTRAKLDFVKWVAAMARTKREADDAFRDIETLGRLLDPESPEARELADAKQDLEDRRAWEAQHPQKPRSGSRWWDLRKFSAVESGKVQGAPGTGAAQLGNLGPPPSEVTELAGGTPPAEEPAQLDTRTPPTRALRLSEVWPGLLLLGAALLLAIPTAVGAMACAATCALGPILPGGMLGRPDRRIY